MSFLMVLLWFICLAVMCGVSWLTYIYTVLGLMLIGLYGKTVWAILICGWLTILTGWAGIIYWFPFRITLGVN